MSEGTKDTLESRRHEHSELCNYHRHYSALRFVVFTVYFAIFGGIAAVAFGLAEIREKDFPVVAWARAVGFVVTLAFFLFEVLCERNARYYSESVRRLAGSLGYLEKPRARLKAKYVTYPLYLILLAFWVFALIALRDTP